jgi:hypothetical protein
VRCVCMCVCVCVCLCVCERERERQRERQRQRKTERDRENTSSETLHDSVTTKIIYLLLYKDDLVKYHGNLFFLLFC